MQNPRHVSELLQGRGKKLRDLAERLQQRATVLEAVRRSLPEKLALRIVSAGVENGRLTVGVSGAVWASRLRYVTAALRKNLAASLSIEIVSVRIRIVPPAMAADTAGVKRG